MARVTRKDVLRACAGPVSPPEAPPSGDDFVPSYLSLHRSGELRPRADTLDAMMGECRLCPRQCGARRFDNEAGECGAARDLEVSSFGPHFGEEPGLVGQRGSGTIFLTHCSLRCVFCQNWQISQLDHGQRVTPADMAAMMLGLQHRGCHNINLVTPTHYTARIVRSLDEAAAGGLRLPLVWNTSGWERQETLRLLDGIVDIYMPDFKYADAATANRYSPGARSYPLVARAALLEMHRQVGTAHPATDGVIRRGLIVRHLVMPNDAAGTRQLIEWIAANLPKDTYLNLMPQYQPEFRAPDFPPIGRRLERREYEQAVRWAVDAGLTNLDIQ